MSFNTNNLFANWIDPTPSQFIQKILLLLQRQLSSASSTSKSTKKFYFKKGFLITGFCLLSSFSITQAWSDDGPPAATPEEFVFCTVCHGSGLMGNESTGAPRLSGLAPWYVEKQLLAFKKGWRGHNKTDTFGMEMRAMTASLSEANIKLAAEYVTKTQSPTPDSTLKGDITVGKAQYAVCSACHGGAGEGNQALSAPALTGLNDWYLVRQLNNFRNGLRGDNPSDSTGQQMRLSAQLIKDDQAAIDIVAYLSSLQKTEELPES